MVNQQGPIAVFWLLLFGFFARGRLSVFFLWGIGIMSRRLGSESELLTLFELGSDQVLIRTHGHQFGGRCHGSRRCQIITKALSGRHNTRQQRCRNLFIEGRLCSFQAIDQLCHHLADTAGLIVMPTNTAKTTCHRPRSHRGDSGIM